MIDDTLPWLKAFGMCALIALLVMAAYLGMRDLVGIDPAMIAGVTPP